MAEVLAKAEKYINGEEALISKEEAPQKKKARLTSNEDGAQKDKTTGRGHQRKMENGLRKGVEASEIVWAHLN